MKKILTTLIVLFLFCENGLTKEKQITLDDVFATQWIFMPKGKQNESFIDDEPLGFLGIRGEKYVFKPTPIIGSRFKKRFPFLIKNQNGKIICKYFKKNLKSVYVFELKKSTVVATCHFLTDPNHEIFQFVYKPNSGLNQSRVYFRPLQSQFKDFEVFAEVSP